MDDGLEKRSYDKPYDTYRPQSRSEDSRVIYSCIVLNFFIFLELFADVAYVEDYFLERFINKHYSS